GGGGGGGQEGYNNLIGYQVGFGTINNAGGGANAGCNNFIGYQVGFLNRINGGYNIGIGYQASYQISSGNSNVIIGRGAGFNLTTGSNNIAIGNSAGVSNITTGSNNIAIGTDVPISGGSNQLAIGSWIYGNSNLNIGIGTTNPTSKLHVVGDGYFTGIVTATVFTSPSDIKLKTNIKPILSPLSKVLQLNGVTFNWIDNNRPSVGVIAQDVESIFPELVSQTGSKTVNYNGLIGLLIEAVKELKKEIDDLKNK
ncbi:hypothetical protein EBS02_13115, partial [bacterium]|nr:hypothetical protein [bacterium]